MEQHSGASADGASRVFGGGSSSPIAIMFDLVDPIVPGRNRGAPGRDAGFERSLTHLSLLPGSQLQLRPTEPEPSKWMIAYR
jgi:hypothetical protein